MDPNTTLQRIRQHIASWEDAPDGFIEVVEAANIIHAFRELDNWLSQGGFLPDRWERAKLNTTF